MEQQKPTEQKHLDTITEALDAQRRRLSFVRSTLFFGAGGLLVALAATAFILQRTTGTDYTLWLFLPTAIAGGIGMYLYHKRHATVTATDRMLMNVWMYALMIAVYVGVWQHSQAGLPIMGFLTMGAAIAVSVMSEIYRLDSANRSNVRGSQVGLGWLSGIGAFLSAQIFIATHGGATTEAFAVTLADVMILFFGTGAVLRHNERRSHV